ncbi:MAG: ABC transporter ATP-binding protein [Patescibacteria group bacterium]|nr:ABC transporter ATP-binding protein [Patescibacteria group bacterium]
MIRVEAVVQHYGVRPVLNGVSLTIARGELVCLLGPNGTGKTTLLSVMAGVLSPQVGTVAVDGIERRSSEENELAIRRKTVYLPDHPWLPQDRTGREFLIAVGELYDVAPERLLNHVERLLKLFELEEQGDWPIRSYSNGQRKKAALASALVTDAPLLLLDEPFAGGLDPSGILAFKRVLPRLVADRRATVVLSAPAPELVEELADRIVILGQGTILGFGTMEQLRNQAGCDGCLADVYERLVHPESVNHVEDYFAGGEEHAA